MKANELMIGDWVIIKGHPCKVSYLAPFDIGDTRLSVISNGYDGNPYLDEIEPIPLTTEILEANGFRNVIGYSCHYSTDKLRQEGIVVTISDEMLVSTWQDHNDNNYVELSCGYVHELQRVLRCCGLWELANNFKL